MTWVCVPVRCRFVVSLAPSSWRHDPERAPITRTAQTIVRLAFIFLPRPRLPLDGGRLVTDIDVNVLVQPTERRPDSCQLDQIPPISCASAAAVRPSLSFKVRTSMPSFLSSLFNSSAFVACMTLGGNWAQSRDDPSTSISQATFSWLYLMATCSPDPSIPSKVP